MTRPVNRLARESSPYLRQHQHNPVDWYPWGAEALARARAEDRPILLSVGYSACHWCHVMERESFEDPETAAVMNRLYVNVKVDREERPDVDNVYQTAVQLLRRSGGWPLTAFLTPDGRPFYTGTYFPNEPRYGMPAFRDLLIQVERAFRERRDEVESSAEGLRGAIERAQAAEGSGLPEEGAVAAAAEFLAGRVDREHGGFGDAPKFPSPTNLWTLWRHAHLRGSASAGEAVLLTLRKMAAGGVYDQLGGGFHRYSTDREWLVPHFEKMLYDNALLVPLYLEAWRAGRDPGLLRVVEETLAYLLRDMRRGDGLFYSATDADSEGEEGRYFVWTPAEVALAVADPPSVAAFCRAYDVTPGGNWEGRSILRRLEEGAAVARALGLSADELRARLARAGERLLAARAVRVPPLRDDKVLVSWNAFVVLAFADAAGATGREEWRRVAVETGEALFRTFVRDGRLSHSDCEGDTRGPGLLDDHAALGLACLAVAERTGEGRWTDRALALACTLDAHFRDHAGGAWFQTPDDGEALIVRPRDSHDSAVPAGDGLAAAFFLRLHAHTGEHRWLCRVEGTLAAHQRAIEGNPFGAGTLLAVADAWRLGFEEVVLAGSGPARVALERVCGEEPGAFDRIVFDLERLPPDHPAAGGRQAIGVTAWVCRGRSCSLPVSSPEALRALLRAPRVPASSAFPGA